MTVPQWLEQRLPQFAHIGENERLAILHFTLLWSLFEARVLDANGTAGKIIATSMAWAERGLLKVNPFQDALTYFRNRYFADGQFTHHYPYLNLRPSDQPALVDRVLRGETNDITELVCVVLIIVHRYRNNLVHGEKWEYHMQGQLDNFTHANAVLMKAIDLHAGV
jgi:hypothetical protein